MALNLPQPRNPIVDFADVASKMAPLLFGGGTQRQDYDVAPGVGASSDALMALLTQRGSSTAQADKVVEDILYRAQLAFAPVLADEKKSGMYNSQTRNMLAREATARATAAAAQAVMEDQQRALAAASSLQQSRNQSSRSGTQKTDPSVGLGKGLAAAGAAILGGKAFGAGKKKIEEIIGSLGEPGKGLDTGEFVDASDNLYDPENFAGGGSTVVGAGGASAVAGGPAGGASMLSFDNQFGALVEGSLAPTGSALIASSTSTGTTTDANVVDEVASVANTPVSSQISADSAQTLGPIATQKAMEASGFALPEGMDAETANAMLQSGVSPDAVDPFGYDPDAFLEAGADATASTAGDVAASSGLEAAAAETAATGLEAVSLPNLPYYQIANIATDGALTDAMLDVPILGDALMWTGETVAGIPGGESAAMNYGAQTDFDVTLDDNAMYSTTETVVDAAGDASIVCTESVKQGLLDRELYKAECEISRKILHPAVFRGYHKLAAPLVRAMRKDRKTAERLAKFANAWGQYIVNGKPSWRAAFVLFVGVPASFCIGLFCKEMPLLEFYRDLNKAG